MKQEDRDKVLIAELLDTIYLIQDYLPKTKTEFMQDTLKQDGILMRLQVVGELMRQQSEQMREKYPDLPWKQAVGLRNIIAHEYGSVDLERVWALLSSDFKIFVDRIREIADELGTDTL
jgi:uncharacterized protein with HEPN domain